MCVVDGEAKGAFHLLSSLERSDVTRTVETCPVRR